MGFSVTVASDAYGEDDDDDNDNNNNNNNNNQKYNHS